MEYSGTDQENAETPFQLRSSYVFDNFAQV